MPDDAGSLFADGEVSDRWPRDAACTLKRGTFFETSPTHLYGPGFVALHRTLKEYVLKLDPGPIEFLKVAVKAPDGSVASDAMYILRPLVVLDCINQEASGMVVDQAGTVVKCENLVLHGKRAASTAMFIRPSNWPNCLLVNRYRFCDAINHMRQEYQMGFFRSAFATGKIKRIETFPATPAARIICGILEEVIGLQEFGPDLDLGKLKLTDADCKQLDKRIGYEFCLPMDWTRKGEMFKGPLRQLIKRVKKMAPRD